MKKYRALLISAACVLLLGVILLVQALNNPKKAIQTAEIGEPLAETLPGDGTGTDIYDQSVPMGESAGEIDPYIREVVDLVNAERAKAGAGPLVLTDEMDAAAAKRAEEIAADFSHYRPDGSVCFTVFGEFGISGAARAENIAGNFRSPQEVLQAWMDSEGHRKNIMNENYTRIGVGVYTDAGGKLNWVQLFSS